jgi:MOSC domain-containing protein YiiM
MSGRVSHLCRSDAYTFSKRPVPNIRLLEGLGVEGDVHSGITVKHRSRVAADPSQPNLRQVHLIGSELLTELGAAGYDVHPGRLGENILTEGLDLLSLPRGTRLVIGSGAVVELTGLRNPCAQLNKVGPDLMQKLAIRNADGTLTRRAGVMAIVVTGGELHEGDPIRVSLPAEPHHAMERV